MDNLGDRMKMYEMEEAGRLLETNLPIVCRWDGRSFSKFTKGLIRPYDHNFSNLMIETAKFLLVSMGAVVVYTQSDEISAILYNENKDSEMFFNGRIQKLTSVGASLATAFFNKHLEKYLPEKAHLMPVFDLRVWNVPSLIEACNSLVWREIDATKNAISMASSCYYSHTQLHLKNSDDKIKMLKEKGIDFEKYPDAFKKGTYVQKQRKISKYTVDELSRLPENHHAHKDPNFTFERNVVECLNLPSILKVKNKIDVLIYGKEPILGET